MRSFSAFLLVSSLFLVVTITAGAAVSVHHDAEKPLNSGGWQPIKNVSDPHVQEIGKFAVAEYDNKSKAQLVFQEVVKGETQVVAGINYRLTLKASGQAKIRGNGAVAVGEYEATVWEKPDGTRQLTSFKQV
uniref:Cystatin domain-containing protein n=1 Tax=Ananas comosus var. bracteatus TaxID=296719 RepID=A0A6V7Q3V6_ANACO|nr:unnamed protein product [Ananas comosus var. bracteatus]